MLLAACGSVESFAGPLSLRAATFQVCAGAMCSVAPGSTDPLPRRSFVAASLLSSVVVQRADAEVAAVVEDGSPSEVVVQGEMRLEVGADKKLQKAGGKGRAEVVLRIVGKGIISKTEKLVSLEDFPVRSHYRRSCDAPSLFCSPSLARCSARSDGKNKPTPNHDGQCAGRGATGHRRGVRRRSLHRCCFGSSVQDRKGPHCKP